MITESRPSLIRIGAFALMTWGIAIPGAGAALSGGSLDPTSIPKYVTPLVIPPVMPPVAQSDTRDDYEIAVRQFQQQILPPGLPPTTVWGYGSVADPATFNYPAFTIEAQVDRPVQVKWVNGLVDGAGNYLPHLLAVDPTLHWANPPGGIDGRDSTPSFSSTPGPYTGPVPLHAERSGPRRPTPSEPRPRP